jgi:hypothetical protein
VRLGWAALLAAGAGGTGGGAAAQANVPVVSLPNATVHSAERFGTIMNVRELPGGKLLVDDGRSRMVKLLTPALATERVVLDSSLAAPNSYGNFPLALIPYLGDSTLFPDPNKARGVLVIDPNGNVARVLAMPNVRDVALLRRVGTDDRGRIIFMAFQPVARPPAPGIPPALSDSAPLLRADLAARTTDTIAWVARPMQRFDVWPLQTRNRIELSFWQPNPLESLDEWAVLTDGSLAMLRGHDYHIDWLRSDGARESTPKLPFDWKQLTDENKQKLVDTLQAQWRAQAAANTLIITAERSPTPWPRRVLSGSDDPAAPVHPSFDTTKAVITDVLLEGRSYVRIPDPPPLDEVFDYYAPVRTGAALADMANHLWILPTTSKQSKAGELVYDVVDTKGAMIQRVRLPLGRYIVGFGRDGAVYMAAGNTRDGFTVERSTLPRPQ